MSSSVDMMSAARVVPPGRVLGARLERLTGEEASCCVPQYEALAKELLRSADFRASLQRAKALADPNRLLAVSMLKRRRELCACEIQAATGLTHPTVSHHMAVLTEAGIVTSRSAGKWLYYRLADGAGDVDL